MNRLSLIIGLTFASVTAIAQSSNVYLSRYLPGGQSMAGSEVTLFNSAERAIELAGYHLVTRYWVLTLPEAIQIPAYSSLTFAAEQGSGVLVLGNFPGFSRLTPPTGELGDFIALINPSGQLVDGFYLAEQQIVSFLPITIANKGDIIDIPGEGAGRWSYLQALPDPVMSFDRNNGKWRANGRRQNIFPATEYLYLTARMTEESAVSLKWKTVFEKNCLYHLIERSSDNHSFEEVGRIKGQSESSSLRTYQFIDKGITTGAIYYYRIRHVEQTGGEVVSNAIEVKSTEGAAGFQFDVFKEGPETGQYLRVRYSSRTAQEIHLKLLDEQLRQIEVLSTGTMEPSREYLVAYRKSLPAGIYYLIVETDQERYHEVIVIE